MTEAAEGFEAYGSTPEVRDRGLGRATGCAMDPVR